MSASAVEDAQGIEWTDVLHYEQNSVSIPTRLSLKQGWVQGLIPRPCTSDRKRGLVPKTVTLQKRDYQIDVWRTGRRWTAHSWLSMNCR